MATLKSTATIWGQPPGGEVGDPLQRTRLLEEVGGAGDDRDLVLAAQQARRALVQLQYLPVGASDDQQGRRDDRSRSSPARSGRPPRETTARISSPSRAAARNAAAAPVEAPK